MKTLLIQVAIGLATIWVANNVTAVRNIVGPRPA
jgi:hypothetical protein